MVFVGQRASLGMPSLHCVVVVLTHRSRGSKHGEHGLGTRLGTPRTVNKSVRVKERLRNLI